MDTTIKRLKVSLIPIAVTTLAVGIFLLALGIGYLLTTYPLATIIVSVVCGFVTWVSWVVSPLVSELLAVRPKENKDE